MNSQMLIGLAIVMLLGAGAAGYWGLELSQPSAPVAQVAAAPLPAPQPVSLQEQVVQKVDDETRVDVVVLARAVPANIALVAEDLAVERLQLAPPDSFAAPEPLLGKTVWRDLAAGTVLNSASFEIGGPLARMIRADERALAIQIDEVVGSGGHLRPGDYVDVLLFLNADDKNSDRTMQLVIPALRVLSVGAELGLTLAGESAMPPPSEDEQAQGRNGQARAAQARNESARSAVLAIPEPLMTRFALAANVGTLSLAVRSADEKLLENYYAGEVQVLDDINQQLFQFEKLALGNAERPQPGLVPPPPPGIRVFRGSVLSRDTP